MNFDLLYPDIRENGQTQLRQCQLVMARMFKIFDYLCKKHEIEYFLVGGTLLGAVRHEGFIPWDDDMDVGMTRKNYDKFVKLAAPELPRDIFFQTPQTDRFFPSAGRVEAKLKDRYSSYVRPDKPFHTGLQIDIGVYDKAYFPHNAFIYLLNRLLMVFFWQVGDKNVGNYRRATVMKWIERFSPFAMVYSTSYISSRKMINLPPEFVREREIKELVTAKFEGVDALIPKGWDACLKRQFGKDYMQIPPVEKRRVNKHGFDTPNPFTPCNHYASLRWSSKVVPVERQMTLSGNSEVIYNVG